MHSFHSQITRKIFSNLDKEDTPIITDIHGNSITRNAFKKQILHCTANGRKLGIDPTKKVAIFLKDSIDFSTVIITSLLCGAQVVLLDPTMGKQILLEKIKASGITHIILEGFLYDYFFLTNREITKLPITFITHSWSIFSHWNIFGTKLNTTKDLFKENTDTFTFEDVDEESASLLVFTGGTTGDPKGVIHSHKSLYETLKSIEHLIVDSKIFYADMPHFLLLGLISEAHIITGPHDISPKKLHAIIEKFRVDTYFCPPYKYNYFIDHGLPIPRCLKHIMLGSAPVYVGFLEKLLALLNAEQRVTCVYGMTEILPIATIDAREKIRLQVSGDILGKPLQSIQYFVENEELIVQGPHQMKGYLGKEYIPHIYTGDQVKIENNLLVMTGRKKDMIIRRDFNIYPAVYESIISKIPGINTCALVGKYDESIHDETVVLFVEKSEDIRGNKAKFTDEASLYKLLKSGDFSIDSFALPDKIIFGKIPRTGRQKKIDKNLLREGISI